MQPNLLKNIVNLKRNSSKNMHEEIIGIGIAKLFIERMKLEGWIPIKEYFNMRKLGIELDWVLVLTIENDGFIAIPTVAEYRVPHQDSRRKSGWYNSENKRLDDYTNIIMFKPIETKNTADDIRSELLDKYEEEENIKNIPDFRYTFDETVIKLCKGS